MNHRVREDLLQDHRFSWVRNGELIRFLAKTAVFPQAADYNFKSTFPAWLEWLRDEINCINDFDETDTEEGYHWKWGAAISVLTKDAEISLNGRDYLIWHQYRMLDYLLVTSRAVGVYESVILDK